MQLHPQRDAARIILDRLLQRPSLLLKAGGIWPVQFTALSDNPPLTNEDCTFLLGDQKLSLLGVTDYGGSKPVAVFGTQQDGGQPTFIVLNPQNRRRYSHARELLSALSRSFVVEPDHLQCRFALLLAETPNGRMSLTALSVTDRSDVKVVFSKSDIIEHYIPIC